VIDSWGNTNNWYQSEVNDLKLCLPRGGDCQRLGAGDHLSTERQSGDGEHVVIGEAAGDHRLVERYGGCDRVLSSARRWTWMILDGRGGAKVRCQESHQDRRPGECIKESWLCELARRVGIESVSRRCVQVLVSVRIWIYCS
jgi:hypothetical protein